MRITLIIVITVLPPQADKSAFKPHNIFQQLKLINKNAYVFKVTDNQRRRLYVFYISP